MCGLLWSSFWWQDTFIQRGINKIAPRVKITNTINDVTWVRWVSLELYRRLISRIKIRLKFDDRIANFKRGPFLAESTTD